VDYPDFEMIGINDGSRDDILELAPAYLIRRRGGKALSRTENTRNANRQTALMLPVVQADGPLGHGASAGG